MATPVNEQTDIQAKMKKLAENRKTFWLTSNKFGRVIMINKEIYNHMLKNNDTLRDANGLNDVFAVLSKDELKVITKYNKAPVKAPISTPKDERKEIEEELKKKKAELKKEVDKIYIKKVSQLRNFMNKFLKDEIDDEKTGLNDEVLAWLRKVKPTKVVDNSEILAEKDAEIEKLKAELLKAKKSQPKKTKAANKNTDVAPESENVEVAKTEDKKDQGQEEDIFA